MLDSAQVKSLETRLRAVEARTGVQVVVAAVERADIYHGLRWRAFAFGAALKGGAVALCGILRPEWIPDPAAFFAVVGVLGAGLVFAVAATLSPTVARLFLEPLRAQAEVRERAMSLFLERELFATGARTAVLLLACGFERQAVVHADVGFFGRVADDDWRSVGNAATAHLGAGRTFEGLIAGLDALERLLAAKGFAPAAGAVNELPDRPVTGRCAP